MRGGRVLIALLAAASICGRPTVAAADPCDAPDDAAGVVAPLHHVAAVLKPGSTFNVLAVGSASLFGPDMMSQAVSGGSTMSPPPSEVIRTALSESSFPQQMAKALEAAVPGLTVSVAVRGGRGLSAADLLRLLQDNLGHDQYQLVIWQTGTVEAVRNTPPSEFAEVLTDGASTVKEAGADLVVVDPQYSRFLQTNTNIEPYQQALEQIGAVPGVLLFHRFDLMRDWVNAGQIDLERTPKADRKHAVEQLHACLGVHLARLVLNSARD